MRKPKVRFAGYVAVRVMDEWLEIISIAVAADFRGFGVGRLLLQQGERARQISNFFFACFFSMHLF